MAKTKEQKRTAMWSAVGTLIGAFVITALQVPFSYEKQLVREAEKVNKGCPVQLDYLTRLDSVSTALGGLMVWHYTLDLTKEDSLYHQVQIGMFDYLLNNVKLDPGLKRARQHNISFRYAYRDRNGNPAFEFFITPAMYNQ